VLLVDTSVWIGHLRGSKTRSVVWFREILDRDIPFGLTATIYQEVLQGADSEDKFQLFKDFLGTQIFFHPRDPLESYAEAARIYFRCRRAGFTIRSTIDCLIAQIALEYDLLLLHDDRDFDFIATVVPELQLYQGFASPVSSEIHEPEPPPYDG